MVLRAAHERRLGHRPVGIEGGHGVLEQLLDVQLLAGLAHQPAVQHEVGGVALLQGQLAQP